MQKFGLYAYKQVNVKWRRIETSEVLVQIAATALSCPKTSEVYAIFNFTIAQTKVPALALANSLTQ